MPSHDKAEMGDRLAHTNRGFFGHISGRESAPLRSAAISNGFDRKGMVPAHISRSRLHRTWHRMGRLERPQEVDDVLLLLRVQPIEMVDDFVRLALAALMIFDRLH
jgi:hypothetical protein